MAGVQLTSETFWLSAGVALVLDAVLILALSRWVNTAVFLRMGPVFVVVATLFWGIYGYALVHYFWVDYYQYFYPSWVHGWPILLLAPLEGVVLAGVLLVSLRTTRWRLFPTFMGIIGIEAFLEHVFGVFQFRIMDLEILKGVNVWSVLAFSVPEYIFYWCVILLISFVFYRLACAVTKRPWTANGSTK